MFQCLPSVGSDPTVPGPPGVTQQVTTWGQIRQRIRELDIEILLLRLTSCGLWAKGWHPPHIPRLLCLSFSICKKMMLYSEYGSFSG